MYYQDCWVADMSLLLDQAKYSQIFNKHLTDVAEFTQFDRLHKIDKGYVN